MSRNETLKGAQRQGSHINICQFDPLTTEARESQQIIDELAHPECFTRNHVEQALSFSVEPNGVFFHNEM